MSTLLILNLAYGAIRPFSPIFCEKCHITIENIVKIRPKFHKCFIVNDLHSNIDNEFKFIPPHMTSQQDTARLDYIERRLGQFQFLTKQTFSAIRNEHNRKIIINDYPKRICVVGFTCLLDVIPTALDLIDAKQNVTILPDAIDDISPLHKQKGLEYLNYIGVKDEWPI